MIARAVDDLTDDWHRAGGTLHYDQVVALISKRAMSGAQQAAVVGALESLGIDLVGVDEPQALTADDTADRQVRGDDAFQMYLKEVGRYPLIFAADEVRLGRIIQAGLASEAGLAGQAPVSGLSDAERNAIRVAIRAGLTAQADLIRANLRLVISVAKSRRYFYSGVELSDRVQDGNIGLMRAVQKFDPSLGFKFSTYATWWIRQSVERGIADRGRVIRLPSHLHEKVWKVRRAKAALTRRHDREPSNQELADATGFTPGAVQAIMDESRSIRSLDVPIGPDGDVTLGDLLAANADVDGRNDPMECVLRSARHREIKSVMRGVLPEREADILERRHGLNGEGEQTLDAIGGRYCVTRERIRQLEIKAINRLRKSPEVCNLYEYLIDHTRQEKATPSRGWPEPLPTPARGTRVHEQDPGVPDDYR